MPSRNLPDPSLLELSLPSDYKELERLGYEEFINKYPKRVKRVFVEDNTTIPQKFIEYAKVVIIRCRDYQFSPVLNCIRLECQDINVSSLPELPECRVLDCRYNNLTSLPDLPKCESLWCDNNKIIYLPDMPNCKILSAIQTE
jgi:hypothetical protein